MTDITLTGRQVGRIVGESPGNISIKARIHKWPGTSGRPWEIPAQFVSEKYGIPVSKIKEKLLADDQAMADSRAFREQQRAKLKGGK